MNENYVVATIKDWNINQFQKKISKYDGNWFLFSEKEQLNLDNLAKIKPKYIFFPHWSWIVPDEIIKQYTCICFHETALPYGRGGSPIQNLIKQGHAETKITALKMTSELDAGDIYLQVPLSLEGLAEEIFIRTSEKIADMIKTIIDQNPIPVPQKGEPVFFKRRTPEQSQISNDIIDMKELFDHIRMLDAESYPRAYLQTEFFKFEFTRPAFRNDHIFADVKIIERKND